LPAPNLGEKLIYTKFVTFLCAFNLPNNNPFKYLVYLFEKLPNVDIKDPAVLDEYMPWSDALPTECRLEK